MFYNSAKNKGDPFRNQNAMEDLMDDNLGMDEVEMFHVATKH